VKDIDTPTEKVLTEKVFIVVKEGDEKMKPSKLKWDIGDEILEVANMYNEVTTSDLQGLAEVASGKILGLVKAEIIACGINKPGNHLNAVQCLWEKGLM
jgi:hypothetical protein